MSTELEWGVQHVGYGSIAVHNVESDGAVSERIATMRTFAIRSRTPAGHVEATMRLAVAPMGSGPDNLAPTLLIRSMVIDARDVTEWAERAKRVVRMLQSSKASERRDGRRLARGLK